MRYLGIRPEREREKNKKTVYALIKKHQGSTLTELIDLAPLAKDTVVACVRELVKDSTSTNILLVKMMMGRSSGDDERTITKHLEEIIGNNKRNVSELRLGKRKIYTSLGSGTPLASVAQSMMLSMHRLIADGIIQMKSDDLPLKDKIENAKDNLDTVCNILWELITSDIENPTKIRFTKEIRECRERIKEIFDITRKDPDAEKILPHLYVTIVRKPTFTEESILNPDKLIDLPISPIIIDLYIWLMKNLNSEQTWDSP